MADKKEDIHSLRDTSSQLQQAHGELDQLLLGLTRSTQQLNQDWDDPSLDEINSIIAQLTREISAVSGTLQQTSQQMSEAADEATREEERAAEQDEAES